MIMDVNQQEVLRVMNEFGVTQLIHGHTHRPAIHSLIVNDKPAKRIVLGDWEDEVSYLLCGDQQLELVDHRVLRG